MDKSGKDAIINQRCELRSNFQMSKSRFEPIYGLGQGSTQPAKEIIAKQARPEPLISEGKLKKKVWRRKQIEKIGLKRLRTGIDSGGVEENDDLRVSGKKSSLPRIGKKSFNWEGPKEFSQCKPTGTNQDGRTCKSSNKKINGQLRAHNVTKGSLRDLSPIVPKAHSVNEKSENTNWAEHFINALANKAHFSQLEEQIHNSMKEPPDPPNLERDELEEDEISVVMETKMEIETRLADL